MIKTKIKMKRKRKKNIRKLKQFLLFKNNFSLVKIILATPYKLNSLKNLVKQKHLSLKVLALF